MVDFTSALYLGLRHSAMECRFSLTTGKPLVLENRLEAMLAERFAAFTGFESALVAPSTLHLVWDFFSALRPQKWIIFIDCDTYHVSHWGTQLAAAKKVKTHTFNNPAQLRWLINNRLTGIARPLIVCDGWNQAQGQVAPIEQYYAISQQFDGCLLVDDTQALGILGSNPNRHQPWGGSGNGSIAWHGLSGAPGCVMMASLAKGFGAPLALMAGDAALINRFCNQSQTRVHSSPPSVVVIQAALDALAINRCSGDYLRHRLWQNIALFRHHAEKMGVRLLDDVFPIQSFTSPVSAMQMQSALHNHGIKSLLLGNKKRLKNALIIRADHSADDVLLVLARLLQTQET